MFNSEEGVTAALIVMGTVIITSLIAWVICWVNKIDSDTGKERMWDDPTTKDYK